MSENRAGLRAFELWLCIGILDRDWSIKTS
jgi:hypothetical protein